MTISEEKKQLRHQIRARERKLAPDYRVSSDQVIAANILDFPIYQSAWTVFCFVSTSEEINTSGGSGAGGLRPAGAQAGAAHSSS